MYAATYPERVSHLLMFGSFARIDDVELGDVFMKRWAEHWGTAETLSVGLFDPSKLGDAAFLRWVNRSSARPQHREGCSRPGTGSARWI